MGKLTELPVIYKNITINMTTFFDELKEKLDLTDERAMVITNVLSNVIKGADIFDKPKKISNYCSVCGTKID